MSAIIDIDDPLAVRDTPPQSAESERSAETPPTDKPRRGRKPGDAQLKLDLKEIEEKRANLLELPAIPMVAAGDTWPAQHIETRARPLAKAIAQACKDNPQLREKLLQILRVGDNASLLVAALTYAAPVVLYYGLLPIPPIVKHQFQIPDRNEPGVRQPSVAERMRAEESLRSQNARPSEDPQGTQGPQAGIAP